MSSALLDLIGEELFGFAFRLSLTCCSIMFFALLMEHGFLERFAFFRKLSWACAVPFKLVYLFIDSQQNSGTVVQVNGEALSITYPIAGRKCQFHLEYNRSRYKQMQEWKVYLVYNSKRQKPKDITQEPGIPYHFTAEQLGGEKIMAQHKQNNKIIMFDHNVYPEWITKD